MRRFFLFFLIISCVLIQHVKAQTCNVNCNGDFDDTFLTGSVGLINTIPCWSTTANDGLMEPWSNGFNGVPSYSGSQFIELNATQGATMYQTFTVTAGNPLSVSFAHRGRAGIDSMEVLIGPAGGPYTSLGTYGDGTSAWGYYTTSYTPPTSGAYQLLFTPVYWSGGNIAIGNFLDAVSVTLPLSLTVSATPTAVCPGGTSTLTIIGVGSYTWSNGATTATTIVNPLVTTVYTVASSSNGCVGFASLTVNVLPATTIAVTGQSFVCAGNTLTLTAAGATAYTWLPTNSNGSTLVVSPLSTSIYTVLGASSAFYCSGIQTHTVTVFNNPTLSVVPSSSMCSGTTTNIIATGAFTYTWNPGGMITSAIAISPSLNTVYSVTGTAVSGCTAAATSSVFVFSPVVTISNSGISCSALGNATAQAFGGLGPYTYSWQPVGQTGSVITNLSPGTYTLQFSDQGLACSSSSVVNFSASQPYTGSVVHGSVACYGANSATAAVTTLTGGSGSQSIVWSNGFVNHSSQTVNALVAGVWSVTVTDALTSCAIFSVFTVVQPAPYTSSASANSPSICAGSTVEVVGGANGGTPPYIYSWMPGAATQTQMVVVATSGTLVYTLTVVDANNCVSIASASTNVIPLPALQVNHVDLCPGTTASLTASGADTYTWAGTVVANVFTVSPAVNTQYQVVGSVMGCSAAAVINVTLLESLAPKIINNGPLCAGKSLVLSGSGGSQYFWKGPVGFQSALQSPTIHLVNPAYSGIFTLTTTDAGKCSGTTTESITIYALPQGYFSADQLNGCAPFCTNLIFTKNVLSANIDSMSWLVNGERFSGAKFSYCFNTAGNYELYGTIRDVRGCVNSMSAGVSVYPKPHANFDFYPSVPIENYDVVRFTDQSTGAQINQWNWYLINDEGPRTTTDYALHSFTTSGTYPVALVVANVWGCKDTIVRTIKVESDFSYYIPNAFSPNEDGKNEMFRPVGTGILEMRLLIFDRWGETIFSTEDPEGGWDGTFKGQPCKQDVYAWKLYVKSISQIPKQVEKQHTGHVMLIR